MSRNWRAKQKRAGALGQSSRMYGIARSGGGGDPMVLIPGAQGFGQRQAAVGSLLSLGIMKQNRKAGGNNVCVFTDAMGVKQTPIRCDSGSSGDSEDSISDCCACRGPKAYCPNCWERKTRFTTNNV